MVEKEAREYFKEKVYQTVVPRNVRLSGPFSLNTMINLVLEINHILVYKMRNQKTMESLYD